MTENQQMALIACYCLLYYHAWFYAFQLRFERAYLDYCKQKQAWTGYGNSALDLLYEKAKNISRVTKTFKRHQVNFIKMFTSSFYVRRYQKRKKTVKSSLSF